MLECCTNDIQIFHELWKKLVKDFFNIQVELRGEKIFSLHFLFDLIGMEPSQGFMNAKQVSTTDTYPLAKVQILLVEKWLILYLKNNTFYAC